MFNKKVISPEIIESRISKNNFFIRLINQLTLKIYYSFLKRKYKKNSDLRELDKEWESINYNRIALINLILKNYINPTYLEIGCASNSLFDSLPIKEKTGVDPLYGGNVRKTSDEFYALNKDNFDVIFIDGLHTYDQIVKDINNSLKVVNENGWIAIHDLLPLNWKEQHIPILHWDWTGDIWKVAFDLIKTKGLDFKIVSIDHGVGLIRVLKPKTKLNGISKELKNKKFNYYFDNFYKLPVLEWDQAVNWIEKSFKNV